MIVRVITEIEIDIVKEWRKYKQISATLDHCNDWEFCETQDGKVILKNVKIRMK